MFSNIARSPFVVSFCFQFNTIRFYLQAMLSGNYYIIKNYLNHGSLLSQVEGNMGFGEDYGRLIFFQLLDGIEAIHNSNIVHRDIKLDNIMLSGNDYIIKT